MLQVGRRAVCALLSCLDGVATDGSLFVLAATNHPHSLDEAIRRAGRLERDIEVRVNTFSHLCGQEFQILVKLFPVCVYTCRYEHVSMHSCFAGLARCRDGACPLSTRVLRCRSV